jgi:prepilin-type N-terminal cleavage/methylation domain-containing protein
MNKFKKQLGFTLIEFLIVMVIIIILASISVIALNGQRTKARDAKRISDIRQIRTALEFYFSDEGEYPVTPQPIILGISGIEKLCSKAEGGFVPTDTICNAESIYMAQVPRDPLPDQKFIYSGEVDGYDINFITEKDSSLGLPGTYHAHSENIDQVAETK